MARKQPKPVRQMNIAEFERMFPHEGAYLVARRWPEGVRCPSMLPSFNSAMIIG